MRLFIHRNPALLIWILIACSLIALCYNFYPIKNLKHPTSTSLIRNTSPHFQNNVSSKKTINHAPKVNIHCKMYKEFRDLNLEGTRYSPYLCSGAIAYKRLANGQYPMCELANNKVIDELLSAAKVTSVITYLYSLKGLKIPIYTYPREDLISHSVIDGHVWEPDLTTPLITIAKSIPRTTFIDIGSNIGVYTLIAMKENLPTVSFDANIRNLLRLRLSFIVNNASVDERPLIWNFVGNKADLQALSLPQDCNNGGAEINNGMNDFLTTKDTLKVMPVKSSRIMSYIKTQNIVMKMDIQGGEPEFLETSGQLFSKFTIIVISTEFYVKSDRTVRFFWTRGYTPYDCRTVLPDGTFRKLSPTTWKSWILDVWWIKRDYEEMVSRILRQNHKRR